MENNKLINIYFKKSYKLGMGEVSEQEQSYLDDNIFICIVTEDTKNSG